MTADAYRLQPGDLLRVKFLYHPEMDVKLPVRPDGKITLQDVGEIEATGMTADELAQVIRQRSSEFLRDPAVTVIVADLAERGVYVGGEVRTPGFVKYRQGMTPLQAILDRGGFTLSARMDYVVHLVPRPHEYLATRIDMSRALQGQGEMVQLQPNDMVYVPRSTIGDVDAFLTLYVRTILPIPPRVGVGFTNP
ncbi:MAG TPA: polysaccharide biosynthesis/export family protein [Candidatus Binatia bacterium]|nr:polysaccharide biosynthesis/export family protein [Candidatus Binatia bacterium]